MLTVRIVLALVLFSCIAAPTMAQDLELASPDAATINRLLRSSCYCIRCTNEEIEQLVTAWKMARTPKPTAAGLLFHPSAILPLGNGQFVWMDRATADDLRAWGLLSTRNLARVAKAEATRQEYVVDRLGAMRDNPGRLLGQIEREVFGWVEGDEPDFDEIADDEDVSA